MASLQYTLLEASSHGTLFDLRCRGQVSFEKVREVTRQLCEVLGYMHSQNVVHPHLDDEHIGFAKSDFSEVCLDSFIKSYYVFENKTLTLGDIALDPHQTSLEVFDGKEPSPASNVYSLSGMLYRALTGLKPFEGPHSLAIVLNRKSHPPRAIDWQGYGVDPEFGNLIMRGLNDIPEKRPLLQEFFQVATRTN